GRAERRGPAGRGALIFEVPSGSYGIKLHSLGVLYHSSMRIPAFYVALLTGFGLWAQTPPPTIDNDQARVVAARDEPHKKGALHEHKLNRVMVYLDAGRQIITPQGGKPETLEFKAGEVKWSP